MVIAIDNFFGCYLLYCINPKYKGRTYIGFTVNPERRITQHNAGKHKGGAWRTSGRGPWDMALIVHGFPSDIAALRFEWAWQNPDRSRNLKHVSGKKRSESPFAFRVRVMANMLCVPPWTRLPLVVRWLKQEYALDLEPVPPSHIPIAYGPVTAKVKKHASNKKETKSKSLDEPSSSQPHTSYDKQESKQDSDDECLPLATRIARKVNPSAPTCSTTIKDPIMNCVICQAYVSEEDKLCCLNEDCGAISHMKCLAKHFLLFGEDLQILPVEGICPKCNVTLLWGDLIRTTNGFHQYIRSDT